MSKIIRKKTTRKQTNTGSAGKRRIIIRSVQRDQPDLRKLSRAVIAMAQGEAEREAQAQHERKSSDSEASHE